MHLLMLHGNGGAKTRFKPFLDLVETHGPEDLHVHVPKLAGFEGRPLPKVENYWDLFLEQLAELITDHADEDWVYYGHGIGGSLLLEWASRDWKFGDTWEVRPQKVIMHGIIGASLEHRFFPKLMRPKIMRAFIQWLVYQPALQKRWEKKLFLNPGQIPQELRKQFFQDYKTCKAFPVFFDLITPKWYRAVQQDTKDMDFHFLWGEKERVVASRYLDLWKKDFPKAKFDIVPDWDHFPMLDDPTAFYHKMLELLELQPETSL